MDLTSENSIVPDENLADLQAILGCQNERDIAGSTWQLSMMGLSELFALISDIQPEILVRFAQDATTPPTVLAAISRVWNSSVRDALRENPSVDEVTLRRLKNLKG